VVIRVPGRTIGDARAVSLTAVTNQSPTKNRGGVLACRNSLSCEKLEKNPRDPVIFLRPCGKPLRRESTAFLEAVHRRWDVAESYYFTHVRPAALFDLVLSTSDRPGKSPSQAPC
jgi:hypothetical protein